MTSKSANPALTRDSSNIFTAKVYDENYWKNYLAARPKYSQDFYDLIYTYHDAHNKSLDSSSSPSLYDLAHDVGTGPGQVASVLAERVAHIIASDANASHLEVAKHRLADLYAAGNIQFLHAPGEDLAVKCSNKTKADLVVGGQSFALMDT